MTKDKDIGDHIAQGHAAEIVRDAQRSWIDTWDADLRAAWEQAEKDRRRYEKETAERAKQAAETRREKERAERAKSDLRRQR